jgi:CRISPR system Cascade subunit CasE
MYISQIVTEYSALNDIYDLHQRLWRGFSDSGESRDFLFRAERRPRKQALILVQSLSPPQWEEVFSPARFMVKGYDPVFRAGQRFYFHIRVSASVAKSNGPGKQPTRKPLPWSRYEKWFSEQGAKRGLETLTVSRLGEVFVSSHKKKRFSIAGQTLNGTLQVTDPELFLSTYQGGIGRSKAFGFGMLSLKKM